MIASVVERFNRTLKNDMWKLHSIELINESTRWSISYQITTCESLELSACDSSTLLKFRERRSVKSCTPTCEVLHGKKYLVQVNALNKYPIFDLQKFCWRKEKFSFFF